MERGITTPVGSGQGQAFIYDRSNLVLQDPTAPLLLSKYLDQAKADNLAKKKKDAEAGANFKKFMDDSQEYWYRHESEIQGGMDELYNMGAEILTKGADPFTGTDPASMEFRRRKDKIEKMSKYSLQLKELHGEYFKKIDQSGKDGAKYTEASKKAMAEYFEKPLSELIANNAEPPRLELEEPSFSILKYDTDIAKEVSSAKDGGVNDQDILTFAIKSLEDADVNDAVHTQISRLSDTGRQALTAMAQNQGMTPEIFLRYQQMKPHFQSGLDNFDFLKVENSMQPGLSSSSIEKGDITTSVTQLKPARAQEVAELIVMANPKYVQAGVAAGRFGSASNTFDQNAQAAVEWNKKRLLAEAKTVYEKSEDEDGKYGGYSRDQYMSNRAKWLEAVRQGDQVLAREAGDYLKGIELEDGSTVESVQAVTGESPVAGGAASNGIVLNTVRTWKEDGEIKVERKQVALSRGGETDEFLLRMHDQAFGGPAKKQLFGQTDRSSKAAGPYIPGGGTGTSAPAYLNIIPK